MGFYNVLQGDAPYLKYLADHYAMSDNYHQAAMGGTGANHVMLGSGDPRIGVFAQPTVADPTKYAGMPNGLTQSTAQPYFNTSSRPGQIFYPGVTSYGIFSSAESRTSVP